MDGFPSGQRGQTVNLLHLLRWFESTTIHFLIIITRGGAVRKLVGLITRRSQVQILSPLLNAQLAQLVEQRTENPRVSGSIPELGIFYYLKNSFFAIPIFIFIIFKLALLIIYPVVEIRYS